MSITSRLISGLMKLPPAETTRVIINRDLPVPMRDGVVLLADHYAPRDLGRRPTILVRSPYGRRGFFGAIYGRPLAERGFQVLIQSCRGTFGSGGQFDPFRQEHADGMDTIAWMRERGWFTDELVTMGPSYLGLVQWAVAPYVGPKLKAIAIQISASEFAHQMNPGGSFSLEDALGWTYQMSTQEGSRLSLLANLLGRQARRLAPAFMHLPLRDADQVALGRHIPFFQEFLAHSPGDEWWAPADHSAKVADVAAPVSMAGGWYDLFLPWLLRDYATLRAAGQNPYLLIGPWTHAAMPGMAAGVRESLAWFRAHVMGDRTALRKSPVRLFIMGANQWREFSEWPPNAARPERWYLQPGSGLAPTTPPESEPDHYRYDPASPTPARGGTALSGANAGPKDNRPLEARADVLVYTSAVLERDMEVIGPVTADLYVRSSLAHADFFARVCNVSPSGKSTNICDNILRVAPGDPAPESDGSIRLTIELWPTAHCFRRGHRLRVHVSSGAHPRFARNHGTGEPRPTATKLQAADQTVYHDPAHPSAVILSVLA